MLATVLATSLAVLLLACGDVLMARAMKQLGPFLWLGPLSLLAFLARSLRVLWFWLGLAFMAGHFFLWMWVLKHAELSVAVPLTAVQYVYNALLSRWYLGETVNGLRWAGTGVIVLGVLIITVGCRA